MNETRDTLRRVSQTTTGGLLLLTCVTWLAYAILGQGFVNAYNLFTLSQIAAQFVVIGFAQMVALVLGRMNLAVGAVGVIVVMFTGWLMGPVNVTPVLAIAAGLALGALAGALMGWIELKTGLNSFIVTLAMASIYTGAMLILTGRNAVRTVPAAVGSFGSAELFSPYLSVMVLPPLLIALLLWYVYRRTDFGWKLLATGANEIATTLSGVRTGRLIILSFALSGALCAVAGLMETARVAVALPTTGNDWLLTAFIVPVLGGTSLKGGNVSISGALVGAVFLASINSGLVALSVPPYWQQSALALVLLVAVVGDEARRRRAGRQEEFAPVSQVHGAEEPESSRSFV